MSIDRKHIFSFLVDACLNSSINFDDWFLNEFCIHVNKFKETRTSRIERLVERFGSNIELWSGNASLNLPSDIPYIWNHPEGLCFTNENEGVGAKTFLRAIKAEIENVQ